MEKIFDLKQRTFIFSLNIIKFLETMPENYIFQTINKQLLRSGTSVGANIAEGQSAASRKEFINFYKIALKSANETKYWLDILANIHNKAFSVISSLQKETIEISKIIGKCIINLKKMN